MSIDAFLQELFPSPTPGPASFADRFAPALSGLDTALQTHNQPMSPIPSSFDDRFAPTGAPPPMGGGPDDMDFSSINRRLAGGGGVPMPQPRPPEAGPGAAELPPAAPPDVFSRLAGMVGGAPAAAPAEATDARGIMSKLLGMDAKGEKRALSTIAGGFAGGNPAFAGGAFMKGTSGGLTGGLKSDKEETEAETAAEDKTQKQGNFERAQTDKERTSEALRKLYGVRGQAMTTNADTRAKGGGKSSWNKPPHERYKDAMKLIQEERKALYGQIRPGLTNAQDAANKVARAEADKKLADFTKRTLQTYGIDDQGNETRPTQSGAGTTAPAGVQYDDENISGAREAIGRGANKAAVIKKLRENGYPDISDADLD